MEGEPGDRLGDPERDRECERETQSAAGAGAGMVVMVVPCMTVNVCQTAKLAQPMAGKPAGHLLNSPITRTIRR